ncbi:hypothetical protein BDZ90DRAFT_267268 [Jaminaea rosea]|uniref:S-adenosyl-L-methionine dependent methyltransferase n=1 Tax=Jaminaea rosea TaxID=1569628 RepID=A0A316ULR3_9BASI|nr:hypothetical protein BDZ90DRAFT_267268 [Jaminaea rosea]PWN26197.1 hypothetical protein BDZ90DRAFT_267268 [Jaminaea rosea]
MHPRNPYGQDGIDFKALANAHPAFAQHLQDGRINFQDPEALRALNQAVLKQDWGIHVHQQPEDRLCPPVPNRLDYLLWVQDVLNATIGPDGLPRYATQPGGDEQIQPRKRARCDSPPSTRILDIGTGATAIYPILGCALDPSWTFTATDIDAVSLKNAEHVVAHPHNNEGSLNLAERIKLLHRSPDAPLIPTAGSGQPFAMTMCNPPFYTDLAEMDRAAAAKQLPPRGACSGSANEMVYTAGGEVAFVTRMIEESCALPSTSIWYSSLLGKASSLPLIYALLQQRNVRNWGFTSITQGQTKRWIVLWSWAQHRLPDELLRINNPAGVSPPLSSIKKEMPSRKGATEAMDKMHNFLKSLPAVTVREEEDDALFVRFDTASWTRAARRAAMREKADDKSDKSRATASTTSSSSADPALCVLISVESSKDDDEARAYNPCQLHIRWVYGKDRTLFESFASTAMRKLVGERGNEGGK